MVAIDGILAWSKMNEPSLSLSLGNGSNHRTRTIRAMATESIPQRGEKINPERDWTGIKVGNLTPISISGIDRGLNVWKCKCQCGGVTFIHSIFLENGTATSCGCIKGPRIVSSQRTHNRTWTKEYRIWCGIKKRCHLKSDPAYARYGGRGIAVCQRWRDSFKNFFSDMGECPQSPKHCLERKNNDLGYCPENCIWATYSAQMRNRRSNHVWEFNGERHCITEWAEKIGVRKDTLRRRVVIHGWSIERALTTK